MIKFSSEGHQYSSVVADNHKWCSVTTLLHGIKVPFDDSIAFKNSKDPSSKWYNIPAQEIQAIWKAEAKRSTDLGTWYHNKVDQETPNAIRCVEQGGWKYAMSQQLIDGVYPEYITYHPEYAVCGQIDRLEIINDTINVEDHKSNKEIKKVSWNGRKMLLPPVQHLQDCNYNQYALQISTYAYMVHYHNPWMKIGDLCINHVEFELSGKDKYGYPIVLIVQGEPVVKSITKYKIDYLKKEVESLLETRKPSCYRGLT